MEKMGGRKGLIIVAVVVGRLVVDRIDIGVVDGVRCVIETGDVEAGGHLEG